MAFTDHAVQTDGWYSRPKYIRNRIGRNLEDSEDMRKAIADMERRRRKERRQDYRSLLTQYKTELEQKKLEMAAMREEMNRLDEMIRQCEDDKYMRAGA